MNEDTWTKKQEKRNMKAQKKKFIQSEVREGSLSYYP